MSKQIQSKPPLPVYIFSQLSKWFVGRLFLMIIMGILSYLGLRYIGVEFALILAILTGLLDIVPIFGAMTALVIAATTAGITGNLVDLLWVVLLYVLLQIIENWIIEPLVMSKTTGLNPFVVIGGLILGSIVLGPLGAFLAVPVIIIIQSIINYTK